MISDFTIQKYSEFCFFLKHISCPLMTMDEFITEGQPDGLRVVLRHDVDRGLQSALRMAELEAEYGLRSSYYIRITKKVFIPVKLTRLSELGHEVGYHYETFAKAKGDPERAIQIFEKELRSLRKIVPVKTISMHGSPLSFWNNLDLWKYYSYHKFDIKCELSLCIDYKKIYYFTDTGGFWDANRYNIRDRVGSLKPQSIIKSIDDIMNFLCKDPNRPVIINTHPNRWANNRVGWCSRKLTDIIINQAKFCFARVKYYWKE